MRARLALALAGTALAGCADPYAPAHEPPERTTPAPGELAAPPVRRAPETVARSALSRTPDAVARRAAELTTNWTGETVARRYAELAKFSVGEARRAAKRSAAQLPTDPQVTAPGARSTGTVQAIAHQTATRLIVVTRETLNADGLRETRWRVTLAEVRRQGARWALARWEPQP
jgi:hypothetical protein